MPKKRSTKKKTSSTRKRRSTTTVKRNKSDRIEDVLVENLVALQKVNSDLVEKFDKLAFEISSLLKLFESAARTFASHPAIKSTEKDKDFLEKIDKLLDQNKTIAKGLTLMEERVRERMYGQGPTQKEHPAKKEIPKTDMDMQESQMTREFPEAGAPNPSNRPLPKF